jgi:hypothetical protein
MIHLSTVNQHLIPITNLIAAKKPEQDRPKELLQRQWFVHLPSENGWLNPGQHSYYSTML